MLIAQVTDTHIKLPGKLAYRKVDTAAALRQCVSHLLTLTPQPDILVMTGDLVDLGRPDEYAYLLEILSPLKLPIYMLAGNHDEREAMRAAFGADGYLPATGFLHYTLEHYPLRLIALDTVVPMQGGGELCAERLSWLDRRLAEQPERPTVVMMHHPPFVTGIEHMDKLGLQGREAFAEVVGRHPQIHAILCGHLHRPIAAMVGGRLAMTAPSPAHQVALDLRAGGPSAFRLEPPGYQLHLWRDGALTSHTAVIGEFEGPFPFHHPDGSLID